MRCFRLDAGTKSVVFAMDSERNLRFKDAVAARGHDTLIERRPGVPTLTSSGDLKIDAAKVKGVPRTLAGTVGPAIEAFLVAAIKPNLGAVAKTVEQFLEKK